jgi:hypothetical protein
MFFEAVRARRKTDFPDMAEFKKHSNNIAWETEVWLMEVPDHMIHFNGDRFMGPR